MHLLSFHPNAESRPTRARGLKPRSDAKSMVYLIVAPHAGAWIETSSPSSTLPYRASRPTRARGLKRISVYVVHN